VVQIDGRDASPEQMFAAIVRFIEESHAFVEPLYQMEQSGGFDPQDPLVEAGKTFLRQRVVAAAQMLGDLWVSAWQQAPEDSYLLKQLSERTKDSKPVAGEP